MRSSRIKLLCLVWSPALMSSALAAESSTRSVEVRRFDAPEATQAAAVDDRHVYAIGNRVVAQYCRDSGKLRNRWTASADVAVEHLNSGVVLDGKLYCAHSNFPHFPEASSIEIWDTSTLKHVGSQSLGLYEGSLTWIDWHHEAWWAVFAHYTERVNNHPQPKDTRWTTLVRFDRKWRRTAGWTFPEQVIERFEPHSCSGGSWGDDGFLYCTGHDRGEIYRLGLPQAGSTLRLVDTFDVPLTGQGFAWDRSAPGTIYGIDRGNRQIVVVELPVAIQLSEAVGQSAPALRTTPRIPTTTSQTRAHK